jgi:hypothetical protein
MVARDHSLTAIARLRRRAAAVLWAEILLRASGPGFAVLAAYLVAALFGLGDSWLFGLVLLLALAAFTAGFARVRRPPSEAIDRRIEAASGLRHRPLADLDDEPETENELAMEIWRAHQKRVSASLEGSRAGVIAPLAAPRDPYALRGALALLLLTGAIIAGPLAPARLAAAFALPAWPFAGPAVTVWITPPSYVQAPPRLLAADETETHVLAGSRISIIVDSARNPPAVRLDGGTVNFAALDATSHRADAVISASGVLAVGPWWRRLGWWRIDIAAPAAPVIKLTGLSVSRGNQVGLHWNIADPYGLASFGARIYPAGDAGGLQQTVSLPAALGDATGSIDLTNSPYGGLPVGLVLTAKNVAGVAASLDRGDRLVLPGLTLTDATALALSGLRQHLALQPQDLANTANALHRIAIAPPSAITPSADVQLAALATAMALRQEDAQDAVDRLLALEKEIEAGPDFAAQKALAASSQALTAALQRGLNGQPPDAALIQQLVQAMRQALMQHLSALQPPGAAPPGGSPPGGQKMDMTALDQMAREIAEDEAAGRTEAAAQELKQLKKVLKALQSARPMTAAQEAQAEAADAAAQQIAQMTKGESALLDQTHQGNATPGEQGVLQNQLNATMQSLKQAGLPVPGLGQAGSAMGQAQGALAAQNPGAAEDAENAAIQGLQQAAAALAAGAKNRFSISQGSQDMPGQSGDEDGLNGAPDERSTPDDFSGAPNPARLIQQQIIKDDSAPALPAGVHDYYHRLLEQNP